mmetsp:Transcript_31813/g.84955  ORF Transcript_31813/g.84955 Transcript_31813/m.84955 type:complete len:109 (+) Transcript_31813:18-344(+)
MRAIYSVGFILCGSTLFLLIVILIFAARQPGTHAPVQAARSSIEDLRKDAEELAMFHNISQRPQVLSVAAIGLRAIWLVQRCLIFNHQSCICSLDAHLRWLMVTPKFH